LKEDVVCHRNGTMHTGAKRDQFIHHLDRLLNSNQPGSLAKALRLSAQYLEMSPEDIVAECFSRPSGSLRNNLGAIRPAYWSAGPDRDPHKL
jgi:hypothetical protein